MGILKLIAGAASIALGVLAMTIPGGQGLGALLIASGSGLVLSGVGTLIQGHPIQGFGTTTRNPIAPWRVCYGRVRTGGTLVYMHTWGDNDQMLDLVVVLAAHACQSIDEVMFDQQRVQIDESAVPTSALAGYTIPAPAAGSGTSFTPVQQTVGITTIARDTHGVVTVSLPANIPYLTEGDQVQIIDITTDATLNGIVQVAEIISRTVGSPGSIVFTYLSGGSAVSISSQGHVKTRWPDYGRNVYVEYLLGAQQLGQTFIGMTAGVPWQGTGKLCTPQSPQNAGGAAQPNPWTNFCSLQGKTAAFIRIRYDKKYFPSGLPQISFLLKGKNDLYDPRSGPATGIGTGGFTNPGSGYVGSSSYTSGDVLNVSQGLASGGQLVVTKVDGSGAIESWQVLAPGVGYSVGSATISGGHGSGAAFTIASLAGSSGTIGYSENAALCIGDFLAHQKWGFKAVWGTEIPTSPLSDAANICDQTVSLVIGGTEPRYTCNGQFELTQRRGETLQNLLTSCAGRLSYLGGQFILFPGSWPTYTPATVNLTSIAGGPFKWRPKSSIRDLYNGVKGTYISPANKWQSTDFPYYAQDFNHGYSGPSQYGGDINLAADGGDRRWLELHLPFTISSGMAQRIAKIELLRRRNSGTGTFPLNMAGYQFAPLDIISATVPFLGFSAKLLEVAATRFRLIEQGSGRGASQAGGIALGTEIDVQESDSSVYVWSTAEELSPQGYVQSNYPRGQVQETTPWPWSPGYVAPLNGDAMWPQGSKGPASFGLQPVYGVDAQGNSKVELQIKGVPPLNALDSQIANPQFFAVGSNTGGNLPPGDYVVGLSAFDSGASTRANTDYLTLATVTVGGTGAGSIQVTINWGSGDDAGELYLALWNAAGAFVLHYNQAVAVGVTSATITTLDQSTHGGPDPLFDHFGITHQNIVHGGCWGEQVQAVTATTVTIGLSGMTLNQWAGYTLSLLAKWDSTVEVPIVNIPIASSTASSGGQFTLTVGPNANGDTLPNLTTLLAVGDLVTIRFKPTFTTNSFTDPNIANPRYPTGMSGVEAGHLAIVLTGPDAGDVRTVASVSTTVNANDTVNLAGSWNVTPNSGDIVIICQPVEEPEALSRQFFVRSAAVGGIVVAQPSVRNLAGQAWLIRVRAEDSSGNSAADAYHPWRELFLFGGQGTRVVNADATQLMTDGVIQFDTSSPTHAAVTDTLAVAISDTETTAIQLTSGAAVVNNTYLTIDSEVLLVLSGGGTANLTVKRAQLGTTAATHANGATVTLPGYIVYTLLPEGQVPNLDLTLHKNTTDTNFVVIVPALGDTLWDGSSSATLTDTSSTLGTLHIRAPGA